MEPREQSDEGVDEEVAERARLGDPAAFEAVVGAHDRGFRMLAARLVGDVGTDDVLQETYLKAFRAIQHRRGPDGSLPGWLYRIVYHSCLDELRRVRRQPTQPLDEIKESASSVPASDEIAVNRAGLTAALAELSPDQRAAVVLVDALGFNYSEAGAILGIRRGTVASRLSHARSALRRVLGQPANVQAN